MTNVCALNFADPVFFCLFSQCSSFFLVLVGHGNLLTGTWTWPQSISDGNFKVIPVFFFIFFIGVLCYSEFLLPYPYSLPRFSVKAFTSFLRIIKCRNVIVCLTQSSCFFRRFLQALNDKLILMWARSSPSFYLYTNIYIVYNNTAAPNPNPNPISQVQARRIRRRRIMLGRTLLRPPRLLRYSRRLSPM